MKNRIVGAVLPNGQLGIVEEPIPELRDNEVLVEVHASLISPGTEMALARNLRNAPRKDGAPTKFGYSNAGIVLEIKGEDRGLRPGMRVACMGAGAAQHADYAAVPINLIVPIPDEVTFEQAAYLSLAATSLQAVRRTEPALGEYGAVLGQGIVGNLAAQLYRIAGARVAAWEAMAFRSAIAEKVGLQTVIDFVHQDAVKLTQEFAAPCGLDFALFAFGGNAETAFMNIKKCMKVSADGHIMGRAVLVGGCRIPVDGGASTGNLDIRISSRTGAGYHDAQWEHGHDYPAAFVQFTTQRNARELIKLIAEKRLLVDPLTTHKLALENIREAGDLLIDHPDHALGVVLEMKH